MSILVNQIQTLAHQYVRSGSKENRRLQVGRMIKFVEFIEQTEQLHNLHEVGKRHVISFWKAHRDMAPKTANAYWLALCVIWQWSNKPGTPPKPNLFVQSSEDKTENTDQHIAINQTALTTTMIDGNPVLPSLAEISLYLKQQRLSQNLTQEAVSQATGISLESITDIESGNSQILYTDIASLNQFYANLQRCITTDPTDEESSHE